MKKIYLMFNVDFEVRILDDDPTENEDFCCHEERYIKIEDGKVFVSVYEGGSFAWVEAEPL